MLDTIRKDIQEVTLKSTPISIPRIKKVSAVIGDRNEIYEAALRSHKRHNAIHGYDMEVLRERIVGNYWEKPAFLLAKVVEELGKPSDKRNDWIAWFDPDTIVLNPQVPLNVFLPASDMNKTMFIGTHDSNAFNSGAFFMRVNEWTVNLLIETLLVSRTNPDVDLGIEKAQTAMQSVLASSAFREQAVYQPRGWFNAFERRGEGFEGTHGSLLVHFHGLEGDKWPLMMTYLRKVGSKRNPFEVDYADTPYVSLISAYWDRIHRAHNLLQQSRGRGEDNLRAAADRVYHALSFEADNYPVFDQTMNELENVLNAG